MQTFLSIVHLFMPWLCFVSGHVTDLKDTTVINISLGKAHAVALSDKGHVYTFGMNNKGQCGRGITRECEYLFVVVQCTMGRIGFGVLG